MLKSICHFILYRVLGWKKDVTEEHPNKYIICLAPHTSNWDFILGQLYMRAKHIIYLLGCSSVTSFFHPNTR